MSMVLDEAIAELAKLPLEEQDSMARWLLEELRSEKRWDASFRDSQDLLGRLADEARDELAAGRTTELNPDKL